MGDLYVGSSGQKLSFVFDTGSVWTWIPLSECQTCSRMGMELYAEKESETYARLEDSVQVVKYGESSAYGYFSKEMICLKEKPQLFTPPRQMQLQDSANTEQTPEHHETTSCINNFKMLSVIKIEGLSGLMSDGVVGLAPTAQRT